MGFNEVIGFLIVLFIFFFPLLRKLLMDKRNIKKNEQTISRNLGKHPNVLHAQVFEEPGPKSSFDSSPNLTKKNLELYKDRENKFISRLKPTKRAKEKGEDFIKKTIAHKKPSQAMIIFSEILGPPKGIKEE